MANKVWDKLVRAVFDRMEKHFENVEERHPDWVYDGVPVPEGLVEEFTVPFTGRGFRHHLQLVQRSFEISGSKIISNKQKGAGYGTVQQEG